MPKRGVLLVNLGSPDSPSVPDVRKFLREFLMDGRVIDVPYPIRLAIVYGAVLPFRPRASAEAYAKIWTAEGSPLIAASASLQRELRARLELPVELAMRYQNPTIESALRALSESSVDDVLVVPMFPHYAMSSFESAAERVKQVAASVTPGLRLSILPPFYDHPEYIGALVSSAAPYVEDGFDHLLFSFHGVPERHLIKQDPRCAACLTRWDDCRHPETAGRQCYRRHCIRTMNCFVTAEAIARDTFSFAFQSRLGMDAWLEPATHDEIIRLARSGVRRLVVICPAFTVDCLETIEEIGIRGKEAFLSNGGDKFVLIPCLNDHPGWVEALVRLLRSGFRDDEPDPSGLSRGLHQHRLADQL